jgi:PAS domain S-box-containing protein
MDPAFLFDVSPLFLGGAVSLALGILALMRRGAAGAVPFALFMFSAVLWAVSDGLFQISEALVWQLFWTKVEYVGITLVPLFFVMTALAYTGRSSQFGRVWVALGAGIPVITILLTWTLGSHSLIYQDFFFYRVGSFLRMDITYGWWWWVNAAYSYILLIWGAGLFLLAASRSFFLYRSQAVALLLGISLPILGNFLHIFRLGPFGEVDLTPFTFAIAGLPLGWALFRFRLFHISPVAREAVFEGMEDGVIVLDRTDRVSDVNPAAEGILGRGAKELVGRSVMEAIGVWLGRPEDALPEEKGRRDVFLSVDGEARIFEMDVSLLKQGEQSNVGRILVLKDVTEWRALGEELDSAREEIERLADLLPMCGWCRQVRSDEGYWEELESYIARRGKTQFTHGICPSCRADLEKKIEGSEPGSPSSD